MSEQTYPFTQALMVQRHYVCAGCYGRLNILDDGNAERLVRMVCAKCGEGRGLVTREYAEAKRAESRSDLFDAMSNLSEYFPQEKKSAKELLNELGY